MPPNNFDKFQALALVGQVGYTVAIPLVIFIAAGVFCDNKLSTKPLCTLIGLGVGMLVSFYSLYRLLKPFIKKNSKS